MALDNRYHEEWLNISRFIRQLFNYHCACCGKHCQYPKTAEEVLQVHHIDENPGNNQMDNLIPLCASCHLRIEKEARLHAPNNHRQTELFEETYLTSMQLMRQKGLENYGGYYQSEVSEMSSEEFELYEAERDLE